MDSNPPTYWESFGGLPSRVTVKSSVQVVTGPSYYVRCIAFDVLQPIPPHSHLTCTMQASWWCCLTPTVPKGLLYLHLHLRHLHGASCFGRVRSSSTLMPRLRYAQHDHIKQITPLSALGQRTKRLYMYREDVLGPMCSAVRRVDRPCKTTPEAPPPQRGHPAADIAKQPGQNPRSLHSDPHVVAYRLFIWADSRYAVLSVCCTLIKSGGTDLHVFFHPRGQEPSDLPFSA